MAVEEGQQADHQDERGDLPREVLQAAGERGREPLHAADQAADAPDLGLAPRGHHHTAALAHGHDRAGVRHAGAVAQRRRLLDRLGTLLHRHRLAGQGRLVDAQVLDPQQPQIGRHPVPGFQEDHVARYEVGGVDLVPLAVAQNRCVAGQHGAHGLEGTLGLALLDEADDRVDHHHTHDHGRVDVVLQPGRDRGRGQQHVDQRVVELQEEAQERSPPAWGRQAVRPEPGEAPARLLRRQPRDLGAAQLRQGARPGLSVPRTDHARLPTQARVTSAVPSRSEKSVGSSNVCGVFFIVHLPRAQGT